MCSFHEVKFGRPWHPVKAACAQGVGDCAGRVQMPRAVTVIIAVGFCAALQVRHQQNHFSRGMFLLSGILRVSAEPYCHSPNPSTKKLKITIQSSPIAVLDR